MHRIFYIAEVFEEILDYVTKADDDNQTRSNKDLPACARVCKAWVVPSISRTWKTLDNLMHLVKVLGPMKLLPKEHVDDESTERGGGWVRNYHFSLSFFKDLTMSYGVGIFDDTNSSRLGSVLCLFLQDRHYHRPWMGGRE